MPLKLAELALGPFVPIAESLPAMIWMGDSEGRCLYLNKAQRDFWGIGAADIPRFDWATSLLEADQAQVIGAMTEAMAQRRGFEVQGRYRRHDGAVRMLHTRAEPRFAPNGEFLGMIGVNTDITDWS